MRWLYVLLLTAGIVLIVPTVLRALDGQPRNVIMGFAAFTTLTAGAMGLLVGRFALPELTELAAAAALGLAAGAIHPEILNAVRHESDSPTTHEH